MKLKVEELRRINLAEGEVLLVTCPERLPQSAIQATLDELRDVFPNNRVLVVPGGWQIRAVKP